jgi:hypothetical protein
MSIDDVHRNSFEKSTKQLIEESKAIIEENKLTAERTRDIIEDCKALIKRLRKTTGEL